MYIYILALEMASPWNRHCANRIGTLSFPMKCAQTMTEFLEGRRWPETTMEQLMHKQVSNKNRKCLFGSVTFGLFGRLYDNHVCIH